MAIDLPLKSEEKSTKPNVGKSAQNGVPNITRPQANGDREEQATHPTHGTVYELVITNSKGYGLFATDSIPRGTRVLQESSLIAIPSSSAKRGLPVLSIEQITTALEGLSPEQHVACFELYHDPGSARKASKRINRAQERFKDSVISQQSPNAHKIESIVRLHAIYQTNVVRLGDDETSGTGVFPTASRINHSCVPNLQIHYIPSTKTLVAHAVRHINKGEELTINYSSRVLIPRQQRTDIFDRCGFKCVCRACTGPQAAASEERREAIRALEYDLEAFERPDKYVPHLGIPRTPQQALEVAELLIQLLREEGIADRGLQNAYRRCSDYCLKARMYDRAVTFAKKERDIERYCIGADTAQMAHLEANHKGAEFWLKYILSERQTHHTKQKAAEKWLREEIARETATKTKKSGKGKKK